MRTSYKEGAPRSLVLNSGLGGHEERGVWKPAISITHLITIGEKRWREWMEERGDGESERETELEASFD